MTRIFMLTVFFVSLPILAQQKGFSESGMLQLKIDVLGCKSYAKLSSYGTSDADHNLCKAISASDKFRAQVKEATTDQQSLLKYKESIDKIYTAVALEASSSYSPVFITNNACPRIYPYKGGTDAVVFPPLLYDNIFNTLRLGTKEMASRVASDILLPTLSKAFAELKTSIKYVGFSIMYGAKDFTKDYSVPSFDYLLIITPVDVAKDFTSGFVTDQEAINKSDVYLYPDGGEIRKTTLTIP